MTRKRPTFFKKNNLNNYLMITDSGGATDQIKRSMYDRSFETLWNSGSETSGSSTIQIDFETAVLLDAIALQQCNFKTFTITYNAGSQFSTPISISNNITNKHFYFEFNQVSVTSILITITDTIVSSTQRTLGELLLLTKVFSMSENTSDQINVPVDDKVVIVKLSDNTTFKNYLRSVINYDIKVGYVDQTELENYKAIYEINKREPFIFMRNPDTVAWDGEANHYNWCNGFDFYNFSQDFYVNGYSGNIRLAQACGVL